MSVKPFYITTPIFYPNNRLHIGNTYPTCMCDILARMARMVGRPTFFLTGADENAAKVNKAAEAEGRDLMEYLNERAEITRELFKSLHISYDQYIRTTDTDKHYPGVMEMWKRLEKSGDIYEKEYEGFYCVACEEFKTEKDLLEGNRCPVHETVVEVIKEKNYFFRLSKYQDRIKEAIESGEMKIVPEARKNEILSVINGGLMDTSFSRPYKGQANAILVPGDDTQAIYVWGDALVNYISALGFGSADDQNFQTFWPEAIHVLGKDILRFHAATWPGMLLSAGLSLPKELVVTGLLQSGGKKMSKTIGNVIDPEEMISIVGAEGLRMFFAHDVPLLDDGEATKEIIIASYNTHLANGIGNLCNRLLKMMISYDARFDPFEVSQSKEWGEMKKKMAVYLDNLDITGYAQHMWQEFASIDRWIQETEPFKLFKTDPEKARNLVGGMMAKFYLLVNFVSPILPHSVPKIIQHIEERVMPEAPLFAKIETK